jgi:hypothetical protein
MRFDELPDIDQCKHRLELVFPPTAFDSAGSNPLAARAVAAMLYVDAIVETTTDLDTHDIWARPTTCLWLSEQVYEDRDGEDDRDAWRQAALGSSGKDRLRELQSEWEIPFDPWYADNTREPLRDETFSLWGQHNALIERPGLPTTSSKPRWALAAHFADLFDPSLEDVEEACEQWRDDHMNPSARIKADVARRRAQHTHQVEVELPNGTTRQLAPGDTSLIIKGLVEEWSPSRLADPVVLAISEPGEKLPPADRDQLTTLGVALDVSNLLPDVLIADVGANPPEFWIIEVVATDGPIDEHRRGLLLEWASEQNIDPDHCRLLTAFLSRNHAAAKRRLKDLAVGTHAWYLDEPLNELSWSAIQDQT